MTKAIRIGICLLVAFTVLVHGAVEPWSESVLEVGAAALLVCWGMLLVFGAAAPPRWNWLLAPVLGFLGWSCVQYAAHLTEAPFPTGIEILKLSALTILFFLTLQVYRTPEQWRGLIWFLLVFAFLVSVQAILQYFTFNGKLYWFRELHYGGIPFGPYVNRNHFAGFVELTVPPGLAILFTRSEHRDRLALLAILTLLPIGALFLSSSRGGVVSFLVELAVVLILVFLHGRGGNQLLPVAVILIMAGGLIAWLGVGRILERFETYRKLEVTEGRREEMARDTWHIFLAHPVTGTGLGTLETVFPKYETLYDGAIVNHAHNDYLEALAETGIVGGLLGAFFIGILFRESWGYLRRARSPADLALHAGALASCCGLLVHSTVDFNFHIPSNALLFLLQAALATSAVFQIETPPSAKNDRNYALTGLHS